MENKLKLQIKSMDDLVSDYVDHTLEGDLSGFDFNTIKDVNNVYLLGAGDSLATGLSLKNIFKKYTSIANVNVVKSIDFTRSTPAKNIINDSTSSLVIGISNGGESARIIEAIEKANTLGIPNILITNSLESRGAMAAQNVITTNVPKYKYEAPGLRSYFGTTLILLTFILRFSEFLGKLNKSEIEDIQYEIKELYDKYSKRMGTFNTSAEKIAKEIKDIDFYDFIADGMTSATAYFNSAKFVECSGKLVNLHDSEEWCHVNTFLLNPENIPTFIFASQDSASYSRIIETAKQANALNRKLIIVGNVNEEDFPEETIFIQLPTSEKYPWLKVLFEYIPVSLVASYVAEMNEDIYFNDELHLDTQSIRDSKIVVEY